MATWAPNTTVSVTENIDNPWFQLPVKLTDIEGMKVFYISDVTNVLTHYSKFLMGQKVEVYNVTAIGFHAVQIDKRPNSPAWRRHAGRAFGTNVLPADGN